MITRKWLAPPCAPAWPACRWDSLMMSSSDGSSAWSRSGIREASASVMAKSRFWGSGGVGRDLQVAAQPQGLGNDKHQHQTEQANGLEVDSFGFGNVAREGNVQIDQAHGHKKSRPDQA